MHIEETFRSIKSSFVDDIRAKVTVVKNIDKQQKRTPLANSTMMRLPSTSWPSSSYLASSASRGSLNSCNMIQQNKNRGGLNMNEQSNKVDN